MSYKCQWCGETVMSGNHVCPPALSETRRKLEVGRGPIGGVCSVCGSEYTGPHCVTDCIIHLKSKISSALVREARLRTALKGLSEEIGILTEESTGVYGLHLNGDNSPWEEILPGGKYERLFFLDVAQMALNSSSYPPYEAEREVAG